MSEPIDDGDVWSDWLLGTRHGESAEHRTVIGEAVDVYRDRVLDGARLLPGMTLLDVGTGDGLIALGAIARVGPDLKVVLTDVSRALLRRAEKRAIERGVRGQCIFVQGPADRLTGVADRSIDAVTTRAVLAYVPDKLAAFTEFFRVLKPGGRVSICEPIFQDAAFETAALGRAIASRPADSAVDLLCLMHRWRSAQFPCTEAEIAKSPLTNFSDRDLVRFARQAGFSEIHLELHVEHRRSANSNWDVFLRASPHPWAPPLAEIMADRFSESERNLFERAMRPLIESGESVSTQAMAYLTAERTWQ